MTASVSGSTALSPGRERRVGSAQHTEADRRAPRRGRVRGGAHRPGPGPGADVSADIASEAWRPGVAEPVAIHVRPELQARLGPECWPARAAGSRLRRPVRPGTHIPLVVDDRIPTAPGYEVHRAPPPPGARSDLRD